MKKKLLSLFLCCVIVFGLLSAALTTAYSGETGMQIYAMDGTAVGDITVREDTKTQLTAVGVTGSGIYQWQIHVGGDVWANVVGSNGVDIELGYALVANLLRDNAVQIRCRFTNDVGNVTYSNAVTVRVVPAKSVSVEIPAPGTVISEATAANEAVITPAAPAPEAPVQETPAEAEPAAETPADEAPAEPEAAAEPAEEPAADTADEPNGGEAPAMEAPAALMSAPAPQEASPVNDANELGTYTVTISYVFENGNQAANPWTATVAVGSSYSQTIISPTVVGYAPDQAAVEVNASAETTYTVTYKPAEVEYTVRHYLQNATNDSYTLYASENKKGLTGSPVGEGLGKSYDGFATLLYDTTIAIAADGSTEVEIYYDRIYYLMTFDLDGGYGVEPIYARYGAPISAGEPTKGGYEFTGWTPAIPAAVPASNLTFKANWEAGTSGFTVVFWYENANPETDGTYGYSVAGTYKPADVTPGIEKKSDDYKNQNFTGRDTKHFTYNAAKSETVTVKGDGSTVLNVYYTRNTYTLTFRELTCSRWHTHNNSCYKVYKTITAKYQADIHNNFPIKDGNNTIWWDVPDGCESFKADTMLGSIDTMPGENIVFEKSSAQSGAVLYYYIETLNGETGAYTHDGKSFKLYKQITLEKECQLTYSEEFHNITGFTQWWSDPKFDKMEQGGVAYAGYHDGGLFGRDYYYINEKNYLCYTRNSYNLKFYNYNAYVDGKGGRVQYEAPLGGYGFTPEYPSDLEPNAYVFGGWYTTAGCYEGSEADLDAMTMPASDVILYAKWVSKTHTVDFYMTQDDVGQNEPLSGDEYGRQTVPHGTRAEAVPDPKNGGYTFVGWFYTDDNGNEKAFDIRNMPVNRDLKLYGKWSSNSLVGYTIKYQLEDGTEIAPATAGSALAGTTKTFEAKTGDALSEGYRSGYFPQTGSHSLTMDINGGNEFTFVYVAKPEVQYTVRYLEKDTGNVLHAEKTDATRDAVITEKFEQVTGYAPDAYQKRLVLSADESQNIITFWYVKDSVHAPVQMIHWKQNIEGDGYTEYQSSTDLNGIIGQTYTEAPLTIEGFVYNEEKSSASGTLTAAGLVLELYYDRIEYPYEFRFLEQGTDRELAGSVKGSARFEKRVGQNAKDLPGYTLVSAESQYIDIAVEDPADVARKNVKTFYYTEKMIDIRYQIVGPDGCGTLDNYQEAQIKVTTGTVKGSAPTAAESFRFVGWFKDSACTQSVDESWVENNKLTPVKTVNIGTQESPVKAYEAATYYAKFEYDVADLTITKTGCVDIDENQSFIFRVSGEGYDGTVVINGNGSVTIKGLKIGSYTVTEVSGWSWRYAPDNGSQTIVLKPDMSNVAFVNTRSSYKWLGGDAYVQNKLG